MINLKNIKYKRLIFYISAFLFGFTPFLPIPFAPELLHDFINRIGGILFIPIFLILIAWSSIFITLKIYKKLLETKFLVEAIGVPLLFLLSIYLLFPIFTEIRYNSVIWLNDKREVENFINPFLGMKMLDCRQITQNFDVMIIPDHFDIETDILLFSSQSRLAGYRIERTFSTKWHLVKSGSQWGDNFQNCYMQNKSPNF